MLRPAPASAVAPSESGSSSSSSSAEGAAGTASADDCTGSAPLLLLPPHEAAGAPGVAAASRESLFIAAAFAAHSFAEGLSTFFATLQRPSVGVMVGVAMALHKIPEGCAIAAPIYAATGSKLRALAWCAVSAFFTLAAPGVGYAVAAAQVHRSAAATSLFYGIVFCLTSGVLAYISLGLLLPAARAYDPADRRTTTSLFTGMFLLAALLLLFEAPRP